MAVYRVLVFGTTGSGKTSLCNAITGFSMPVSDSANGVTFESYTYKEIQIGEDVLILTDTVGLNESAKGTIPSSDALLGLIKLVQDSKEGFNLIIQVTGEPRITSSLHDNYNFFSKALSNGKIPIILVRTKAENSARMSEWGLQEKSKFESAGFDYVEIIAGCFVIGESPEMEAVYKPIREASTEAVIRAIKEGALSESYQIYYDELSFEYVMKRVYNAFVDWIGLPVKMRLEVNETVYDLMVKMGISPEIAARMKDKEFVERATKNIVKMVINKFFS